MTRTKHRPATQATRNIRCAIYTRKSTEEGLEQEFNSLDAQRESGEAYIASQTHEGWVCLPEHYSDGGFSGGTLDRPGLRRLLADIEAGKVDTVVCYKVDRLSRSLLDFARMMETFDKHHISFVSVTQQFNTATSMGRLVLNVLLSFAQFEREIISERTRDKIAAARRKGKWVGGHPVLGFDIDPHGFRLVINEAEAIMVLAIFELYLEYQALLPVVQELERRGWLTKRWTTKKGQERGGRPFTKTNLHKLLTNVVYAGKIRYKNEIHEGEQIAIVDEQTWQRVQALLQRNGRSGGALVRNQFGALLKGILRCVPCGSAMTPAHSTKKGTKRYRYYTCLQAQKRGWHTCPSKSIPAAEIERFVIDQIKCIGRDPELLLETISQARQQNEGTLEQLKAEQHRLERDLAHWHAELKKVVQRLEANQSNDAILARLADLQERIRAAELRAVTIQEQVASMQRNSLDEEAALAALAQFDPVWDALSPHEQTRLVQTLVERVDYDGGQNKVAITFFPTGIQTLADELVSQHKEKSA